MKLHFKFQISLLILVCCILIISSITTLLAVLSISKRVDTEKAGQLFSETGNRVQDELTKMLVQAQKSVHQVATVPGIADKQNDDGLSLPFIRYFVELLNNYPEIYSVYRGFSDNTFLQLIHAGTDEKIIRKHEAPDGTVYILRSIIMMDEKGEAARELWTYLNEDLEVVGKRVHDRVEYTASSRPWFLLARENLQEGVLTDTYLFDSFQEPGITAAKSIGTQCVVGIDITLASLEDFLNNLYVSENCRTALLDAKGSILASNSKLKEWIGSSNDFLAPINTTFNDNTDMQSLSEVVLPPTREGAFSIRDTYMIWSRSWEPIGGHVFDLIMIAPSEDFLGYLVEMRQRAIASACSTFCSSPCYAWQ